MKRDDLKPWLGILGLLTFYGVITGASFALVWRYM